MLGGAENAARLGLMPAQVLEGIGAQRQQQTQRAIQDAMGRWDYAQQLPIQQLQRYAQMIGAVPTSSFGTQTTQQPGSLLDEED